MFVFVCVCVCVCVCVYVRGYVLSCVGRGLFDRLITRPKELYQVSQYDYETSGVRRPRSLHGLMMMMMMKTKGSTVFSGRMRRWQNNAKWILKE
jgi:hypothetical protein